MDARPDHSPPPPARQDWTGRGAVRARPLEGGGVELVLAAVTSQTRRYKLLARDFLRKETRWLRPHYGAFAVSIVIEQGEGGPRLDVDNVAKAVLDALTGAVFYDDSQVDLLHVRRRLGSSDALVVHVWRL